MPFHSRLIPPSTAATRGDVGPVGCALTSAWLALSLWAAPAEAAPPTLSVPSGPESFQSNAGGAAPGPFGFVTGLSKSDFLLGDMWGLRTQLSKYGLSFGLSETSEVLGNVTGGVRTGFAYDGLTQMVLQLDTERAFGWRGGTFNVSGLQIHGRNLSADNLLTLQTASGIEANPATRLWELWYQQRLGDEDRLDLRVGQMSLDQEFIVSQEALLFVNTAFGWPLVPSLDLPGGGPAYPLSALGVRLRARPTDALTALLAVTNGNPAPNTIGDPQVANPSGTSFPLNGGVLVIGELQWSRPALGAMVAPGQGEVLPGAYKIGFWYNSESFDDLQFDNEGVSLASPLSNGMPATHSGNYSLYGVVDQVVWRAPEDEGKTVNFFARAMGMTLGDRNQVVFSLNAGLTFHGPLPGRGDDVFGIGMGYGRVSGAAAAFDRAQAFYTGAFVPARTGETYLELTYQYQLIPSVKLQPDFQFVFNPGGGIANPNQPTQPVANEAVLGMRVIVTF
jgi:porin